MIISTIALVLSTGVSLWLVWKGFDMCLGGDDSN